jgi:hypothetical protein
VFDLPHQNRGEDADGRKWCNDQLTELRSNGIAHTE